jgi:hypothetical protein
MLQGILKYFGDEDDESQCWSFRKSWNLMIISKIQPKKNGTFCLIIAVYNCFNILQLLYTFMSRDSSRGIMGLRVGWPGFFLVGRGEKFISSSQRPKRVWDSPSLLSNG